MSWNDWQEIEDYLDIYSCEDEEDGEVQDE